MLERIGDFHYVTVSDISGFLEVDGSLVQPLPKRAGASLPLDQDSEADGAFAGDVMLFDPTYLKEACQERENLLTGTLDDAVDPPGLFVRSSDVIAIADVLKAWATRWEADCPSNVFCKPEVFDLWSSWEELGGAEITWEYGDRWSDLPIVPAEVANWRGFIPETDDEEGYRFKWSEKAKKAFLKYALRDYLSIPTFLGVRCDDDEESGTFAWVADDEWDGYYPPVPSSLHILELYSDLEKTVVGSVSVYSGDTVPVEVKSKNEIESHTEYSGDYKLHDNCSDGCGTFHHDEAPSPSSIKSEYSNKDELDISVTPGGFCSISDSVNVTSVGAVGELYEFEAETKTNEINRGYTSCHDGDCHHTGYGVYDFWTSKVKSTSNDDGTKAFSDDAEFDLSDRLENGAEIEKAAIVVFAVSVEIDAEKEIDQTVFVWDEDLYTGVKYSGKGTVKFSVSVRLVECSVDGGKIKLNAVTTGDIPSPSGGESIEVELPEDTGTKPIGSELSPYNSETNQKYKGSRKSVAAFGPLFVKFKPKTLVEDGE